MSWQVLAKCLIEFSNKKERIKAEEKFRRLAKKEKIRLYEYESGDMEIMFEIYGSKYVNYSIFDALYRWCKEQKILLQINCHEWTESDKGYYKNSFEDEEGEEL